MTLKIIGAGFGRTGTMSTYTALNQLGFPCYHMIEVLQNKANTSHLDFWRKVANAPAGIQHDWNEVFARYAAAVDFPASCVWRELIATYPEAKVLLTLHPKGAEAWYESTIETIYFTENRWQFKVLKLATPFGRKFGDMSRKLLWQRALKGTMDDRARAIAQYHRHIEDVKAVVSANRLLIYSVNQGWGPLCKFLGVPAPPGPFPNVNDRADIQKMLGKMSMGAYGILAAAAAAVAALAFGAYAMLT